jgi:acyl carrier protein phosphodiesterase
MNYLAHLYLSDRTAEGFAGSLLGDFVTGSVAGKFNKIVENEILMHRKIDAFTDSHAIVKRSKARISAGLCRYAGVLTDVFYDHYLAVDFEKYSLVPLKKFSLEAYRALARHRSLFPDKFQQRINGIIEYDLLGSYAKIDEIELTLSRISSRIKRPNSLAEGIFDLKNNYQELHTDFAEFFPNLIAFVETTRRQ